MCVVVVDVGHGVIVGDVVGCVVNGVVVVCVCVDDGVYMAHIYNTR